jgi:hypothetical protein
LAYIGIFASTKDYHDHVIIGIVAQGHIGNRKQRIDRRMDVHVIFGVLEWWNWQIWMSWLDFFEKLVEASRQKEQLRLFD